MITIETTRLYALPSGQVVQPIQKLQSGYWTCGYTKDMSVMPPGSGERNRVTLSDVFLAKYARPL